MTDRHIDQLAQRFRHAIDTAHRVHSFRDDFRFKEFPTGCCGDTSYLLAEYLFREGIETIWVSLQREDWSHAWLVMKDKRVGKPNKSVSSTNYIDLISQYRIQDSEEETEDTHYEEQDLSNGLIIDITSDQFDDYENPVYVGHMDGFHRTFEFIQAIDYDGLNNARLKHLYEIIITYIN